MSLTKFETDMNIISRLDDEPNDVGGLSSAQLKAKFDEAGLAIQKYLNEVLLPSIQKELTNLPAGAAGGHYTPSVRQLSEKQVEISFTASKEGMAPVSPVTITLPAGPAGSPGMSAYEAAKKGGYTGTESEFYKALAGAGSGGTDPEEPDEPDEPATPGAVIRWFLEDETDHNLSGEYEAEEGMTWAEFVNSAYNAPGFVLTGNGFVTAGHDTSLNGLGSTNIQGTDVIQAEATYYLAY